jgi:hypothetical protein
MKAVSHHALAPLDRLWLVTESHVIPHCFEEEELMMALSRVKPRKRRGSADTPQVLLVS